MPTDVVAAIAENSDTSSDVMRPCRIHRQWIRYVDGDRSETFGIDNDRCCVTGFRHGNRGGCLDRSRQDMTRVVIGVFTNQIDASRSTNHHIG